MTDPRLVRPAWRGRTNVDALTIAVIEHAERLSGHLHVVTKGSYQPDADAQSGATHTGGGAADLVDCGHPACLLNLRRAGAAAWRRGPLQGFRPHFHLIVVGHPTLSPAAARQVWQYVTGTGNGLIGSTADDGPRLTPIPRPVWPPHPEESDMPTADEIAEAVVNRLMREEIVVTAGDDRPRRLTLRQLLRELHQRIRKVQS